MDVHLSAFQSMAWIGTLPFKGHCCCFHTEEFCSSSETNLDLFQCTTSLYKGVKQIVWFSPLLYPVTGGFGKDYGGQALITDLCRAARSLGNCALVSNGGGGKARNLPICVLLCSNRRRHVPVSSQQGVMTSTIAGTDTESYRKTPTYIAADKKNS